jgi:hypothetical protein
MTDFQRRWLYLTKFANLFNSVQYCTVQSGREKYVHRKITFVCAFMCFFYLILKKCCVLSFKKFYYSIYLPTTTKEVFFDHFLKYLEKFFSTPLDIGVCIYRKFKAVIRYYYKFICYIKICTQ